MAAEDLYTSPLFRGRRACVQTWRDRWLILSGKLGLVHPTEIIAPCVETLTSASTKARRAGSARVPAAIAAELDQLEGITFEIHAGAAHRDFSLLDGLRDARAQFEDPAAGPTQGQQLTLSAGRSLPPANGTDLVRAIVRARRSRRGSMAPPRR